MHPGRLYSIREVDELEGFRVLVRAGLNVPIAHGTVTNDFRILKSLETINYLRMRGAIVYIIAHIGRDPHETLLPVYEALREHIQLTFAKDFFSDDTKELLSNAGPGDVVLFENVRRDPRERDNDEGFAEELSKLADFYVNDAFAASHREHVSIVGLPAWMPSYMGLLFEREVKHLTKALDPPSPSLFILGGAKFTTKEPILRKMLDVYDRVFVGGALANDFFKALGLEVGDSLVSDHASGVADLLDRDNITLPVDVRVSAPDGVYEKKPAEVGPDDIIYDCGFQTEALLEASVEEARFVLWNGPLGNYEKGFREYTEKLAKAIAFDDGDSIIGGGDTVASIARLGLEEQFGFVSTGGGAMLDFLMDGTLPGIEALKDTPRLESREISG